MERREGEQGRRSGVMGEQPSVRHSSLHGLGTTFLQQSYT